MLGKDLISFADDCAAFSNAIMSQRAVEGRFKTAVPCAMYMSVIIVCAHSPHIKKRGGDIPSSTFTFNLLSMDYFTKP